MVGEGQNPKNESCRPPWAATATGHMSYVGGETQAEPEDAIGQRSSRALAPGGSGSELA